jgi:hypothetical protein
MGTDYPFNLFMEEIFAEGMTRKPGDGVGSTR